jgi:hypothetical protein
MVTWVNSLLKAKNALLFTKHHNSIKEGSLIENGGNAPAQLNPTTESIPSPNIPKASPGPIKNNPSSVPFASVTPSHSPIVPSNKKSVSGTTSFQSLFGKLNPASSNPVSKDPLQTPSNQVSNISTLTTPGFASNPILNNPNTNHIGINSKEQSLLVNKEKENGPELSKENSNSEILKNLEKDWVLMEVSVSLDPLVRKFFFFYIGIFTEISRNNNLHSLKMK